MKSTTLTKREKTQLASAAEAEHKIAKSIAAMAKPFTVIKSSIDGACASQCANLREVCENISYHKGWNSLQELHTKIIQWGAKAKPGTVFSTGVTAIVAGDAGSSINPDECPNCGQDGVEHLNYSDLDPVEGGDITQTGTCDSCGKKWKITYRPSEISYLA